MRDSSVPKILYILSDGRTHDFPKDWEMADAVKKYVMIAIFVKTELSERFQICRFGHMEQENTLLGQHLSTTQEIRRRL